MIKLYCPENVERVKFAQIGIAILAFAIPAYLGLMTYSDIRSVWHARSTLTAARLESGRLSRQVAAMRRTEEKQPKRTDGGVDMLALQLSRWANELGVRVESITPQGAPMANDVQIDNTSLGKWNAVKVRVEGNGNYSRVVSLINKLRRPEIPAQMDSFLLQGSSNSDSDNISFDLTLTVYGRNIDAT